MSTFKGHLPLFQGITDSRERLALGLLPGISHVHKFGRNPVVNTTEEDVWNVGGKETLLTAGAAMFISAEDNTNGVGQIIRVSGLDENWEEQTVDVVLTGQTQARIGASALWTRIHRGFQVSPTPDPVEDVWIAETDTLTLGVPDTASKVHGLIQYTDAPQQTEKALFTIPAGHIGLLKAIAGSILAPLGAARSVELGIEIQELADGVTLSSPSWTPWRRIDEHAMASDGDTSVEQVYTVPRGPFAAGTNIALRATATADTEVYGDMDITLYHTG